MMIMSHECSWLQGVLSCARSQLTTYLYVKVIAHKSAVKIFSLYSSENRVRQYRDQ